MLMYGLTEPPALLWSLNLVQLSVREVEHESALLYKKWELVSVLERNWLEALTAPIKEEINEKIPVRHSEMKGCEIKKEESTLSCLPPAQS